MRKGKRSSPRLLVIMIVLVLIILGLVVSMLPQWMNNNSDSEPIGQVPTREDDVVLAVPKAIRIDAININQEVKVWSSNDAVDPESWWDIVWWEHGGHPNAKTGVEANLTTFLFGHASNNLNRKVVFDDLDLLKKGDEIVVTTNIGEFRYCVVDSFIIDKVKFETDKRVVKNEEGRLLLISCWTENQYNTGVASKNIVVIAKLEQ